MKIELLPKTAGIYKINFPNGKFYIGKSINIFERIKNHIKRDYKDHPNLLISKAINKYGVEDVEVLEEIQDTSLLNEKEKYWIKKFDAINNGYNLTLGGDGASEGVYNHQASLNEESLKELYNLLLNSEFQYSEIAEKLNISISIIERVNCGHHYFNPNLDYPIRKKRISKFGLKNKTDAFYNREDELLSLINDLKNTDISFTVLKEKYKIKSTTLSLINVGKKYFNEKEDYPLRKNAKSTQKRIFTDQEMEYIKSSLENPKISMAQISQKIQCDTKVISAINKGIRQKRPDWNYPLRKVQMKTGSKNNS